MQMGHKRERRPERMGNTSEMQWDAQGMHGQYRRNTERMPMEYRECRGEYREIIGIASHWFPFKAVFKAITVLKKEFPIDFLRNPLLSTRKSLQLIL